MGREQRPPAAALLLICMLLVLSVLVSCEGAAANATAAQFNANDSKARIQGVEDPLTAETAYKKHHKDYGYDNNHGYYPYPPKPEPEPEPQCPQEQSADSVDDVYNTHVTFDWVDVAKQFPAWVASVTAASGGARSRDVLDRVVPHRRYNKHPSKQQQAPGGSSSGSSSIRGRPPAFAAAAAPGSSSTLGKQGAPSQGGAPSAPKAATSATMPKAAAAKAAAAVGGSNNSNSKAPVQSPAAAAAGPAVKASTAAVGGDGSTVQVKPAAVVNPNFLLPTGSTESGKGFQGTFAEGIRWRPTDEAIAVGPHPQQPEYVLVLHGVNSVREIFVATRDGQKVPTSVPTKLAAEQIMDMMGFNSSELVPVDVQAFYDKCDERYVMMWSTTYASAPSDESTAPYSQLVVCASANNNPLGQWTCWGLNAWFETNPYQYFCSGFPLEDYLQDYPQASYSHDGIFVSIGGFCFGSGGFPLTALFAFPKATLYSNPANDTTGLQVYRATYLPSSSWYRSLPIHDQLLTYDPEFPSLNPFNTFVLPSRPQTTKDAKEPFFVMGKVDGNLYMSIAKLTNEPLGRMDSRQNAPRIYATVLSKGFNFRNTAGYPDGDPVIPQPDLANPLDAGDVGNYGRTYGAMHHRGLVYVATTEYFGARDVRTPSIYWAIVDPSPKLCNPSKVDYGLVASAAGLALAYPVIAARRSEGALLAYAYGGTNTTTINGIAYPSYAGAASTAVGCRDQNSAIDIIKRGTVPVEIGDDNPQRWGDFSAVEVLDGVAWFAVPAALDADWPYRTWINAQRL